MSDPPNPPTSDNPHPADLWRTFLSRWGLVLVLVLGSGWIVLWRWSPRQGTLHPAVGTSLATFPLEPLTGTSPPLQLADLRGTVTLITFWGPWCPTCLQEFPQLAQLTTQLPAHSFRWLPITVGAGAPEDLLELRESTSGYLKRTDLGPIDTFWDPEGAGRTSLAHSLQSAGFPVPASLVIDQRQIIRGVWIGYAPSDPHEIAQLIRALGVTPE